MSFVSELVKNVEIPQMYKVRQKFPNEKIEDIPAEILKQLSRPEIESTISPGTNIAITAGSRGISNIDILTKGIVDFVKSKGANPFIVPAMGSHGGCTAEGQCAILRGYGITEETMGCPIHSSMETVQIGTTEEDHPVFIDRNAAEADAIIVAGRIKPHTLFRGPYESGIIKMLAIGLGKQKGAETTHDAGSKHMHHTIPLFGKAVLKHANVIFGVGFIENAYDETYKIVALTPQEIIDKEPGYQEESKAQMPKILIGETDVLVVDKIGKNFSGDGMDPNITGTFASKYASGGVQSQNVVVLDLTDETHGNASGIGTADVTTRRAYEKMDFEMTYPNSITSNVIEAAKIPMVMASDRDAVAVAIKTCVDIDKSKVRVIRIKNSLHIDEIYVSDSLLEEAKKHPDIEIISGPEPWPFDEKGNLW